MTRILGLTGSVGMGKSTTAAMFAAEGVPVWDADAAVHRLYAPGGAAVAPVEAAFPGVTENGAISRPLLKERLAAHPSGFDRLNAIVHPLVAADRAAFLAATNAPLVVLDIPLLYETGGDVLCDRVAVVSVPADIQRARVLSRPGMTAEQLDTILARQMPDAEKRARADWVIETLTLEGALIQVRRIIDEMIGEGAGDA
ncbi:dephospho-CoA kinase [Wenxinia marina]|uniref:Dephospho-CoA kinase n=1 Tax=Wenxinia marina DSM 24838 TaxID=1123501 RepID=A0A0D0Q9G3_9RHOB|nr:dephospho-CoA kinase [Wenxinia marina]KIQ71064.1 dephospho-CoA kinase [Wenxinia marina DSM 24838]GGL55156.1 dephospho-CoA kinase [Wenxinia marina]